MHGGASTGPPPGSKNALTHGIYSDGLFDDEKELWHSIEVDSLDDEIRLLKIQLARANKALKKIEESPRGEHGEELEENQVAFELSELEEKAYGDKVNVEIDGKGEIKFKPCHEKTVKRKRPDYRAIIDRLTGRIGKLVVQRDAVLNGKNGGDDDEITIHVRRKRAEE
jgi:hypothetical protein